jgi:hypothetical protein
MSVLGFEVDWFDQVSTSVQKMFLKYFLEDDTIEILHSTRSNAFLKRIYYPDVTFADLFIGNSITV